MTLHAPNRPRSRTSAAEVVAPASTVVDPPTPPPTTIPYLRLLRDLQRLTDVFDEFRDTTGAVTAVKLGPRWLLPPMVVVTSQRGAEEVLGGRGTRFEKAAQVLQETRDLVGSNLFNTPSEAWAPRRRTLQPLFTRHHVSTFARHMATAAGGLAAMLQDDGGVVDLDAAARELTLAVIGRTLFGRELDREAEDLAPDVARTLRYMSRRSLNPLRAPSWCPSYPRRRARTSRDRLRSVVEDAVEQRRRAAVDAGPATNGAAGAELIDLLLTARDPETGERMTRRELVDELVLFLLAGHDTTATTLTAALWSLGRHPGIQREVAKEARAAPEGLTSADLPRLPLTMRVVQESMRLYPPASVVPRRALNDTIVDGYRVAAGTDVLVSIWAIQRDPATWPDPTRFDPDRFLPEHVERRGRWAFLPFGAGPRACIGSHFATMEAVIALATLVRRVEFATDSPHLPLAAPFTVTAKGPVLARVRRRV